MKYHKHAAARNLNVQARSGTGWTVLMSAAGAGHYELAELLIDAGAAVDAREDTEFSTALMWSVFFGYTDVVEILIEPGAKLGAQSDDGHTAHSATAENGHDETARVIEAALVSMQEQ